MLLFECFTKPIKIRPRNFNNSLCPAAGMYMRRPEQSGGAGVGSPGRLFFLYQAHF